MAGSTIDHLIAMTIFLGAILIFVSLFNQIIQTAILYQRNRYLATKCSDLLDNILLNPGIPENWGRSNREPLSFGLQDPSPAFQQYRLSPFSLMRLQSAIGEPVYYPGTGEWYSNITMGFGNFLLVSSAKALNYSTVAKLLGINNTYGFQLTITPIVNVIITENRAGNPLILTVTATGKGFPLANALISYCFISVVERGSGSYPDYVMISNISYTDQTGRAVLSFNVNTQSSYAFIAYVRVSGLVGVGFHQRVTGDKRYVIPLVENFEERKVILAHSYDVHKFGPPESAVFYNATFVQLSEDFTIRQVKDYQGILGKINYGQGSQFYYDTVTLPFDTGVLIITYQSNNEYGVILMPWGVSAMAFPVVFGEDPLNKTWVVTDIRQVTVDKVVYQAKLALWSLEGSQVIGG
ncbi:MAG: hypothetical protein QW660_00540 [Candidatus Bathyarchaeia archaeon]